MISRFHLSIPARNLQTTEDWYVSGLGCRPGRRSERALILQLGGHQLVAQLEAGPEEPRQEGIYPRHFGLILDELQDWQELCGRARQAGLQFAVEPKCRFAGEILEHHTFFLIDPSGNWLEFKHYTHPEAIFGCTERTVVGDEDLRR